ncbi:hypothetical protein EJ08DRAFT_25182 [Tothia fuscella]|uniref:Deoxyribonuclease NucA/NucB domain-containing protein n=1 Tax=Tothia fuscella TaxID=1048955 RepID=A0A9P4TTT3_9PEZI|nr:hypothetical protein EJ08DRAFT_25182 [Tothia fuscella]
MHLLAVAFVSSLLHQRVSGQQALGRTLTQEAFSIFDKDLVPSISSNLTSEFVVGEHERLFARQQQCANSGYVPCANQAGCCPAGDNCVAGGCCSAGKIKCGSNNCYDPTSEICCNTAGLVCYKSQTCVSGGCCPAGQQKCGTSKCYDPATQKCCEQNGQIWPCPASKSCCDVGACYEPSTEQCCVGGACLKTETCCKTQCCRAAAYCASNGVCSRISVTTTSSRPTPSASRPVPTPDPTPYEPKPAPAPVPAPKPPTQNTKQTITFNYDPNRKVVIKKGANAGKEFDGSPRAVLENMCKGIQKILGYISQEIELTRASEEQHKSNRATMCPEGWCADGVRDYIAKFHPQGVPPEAQEAITAASTMSCDEFPFARSVEGGDLATGTRICVPITENNWQGGSMGNYFKEFTDKAKKNPNSKFIAEGDKFTIKLTGWDCKTNMPKLEINTTAPAVKRRDAFAVTGLNVIGPEMYRSFDPDHPDVSMMTLPLGDLAAGSYSVNLTIVAGDLDLDLVDSNGGTYDTTISNGVVSFTLAEDVAAAGLVGTTTDENVEVVYHAAAVQSSPATPKKSVATSLQIDRWMIVTIGLLCLL